MTSNKIKEDIDDAISQGIASNLYRAEQALFIYRSIGKNSLAINAHGLGYDNFFGSVQRMCIKEVGTSLAAIFEQNKRYSLRSIPWVLNCIENNPATSEALEIENDNLKALAYKWRQRLTQALDVSHKEALRKLRMFRDKRLAHDELISDEDIDLPTWTEIDDLLKLAKELHAEMGFELVRIIYQVDDGSFTLSDDASRASRALERLLNNSGVIKT